MKDTIFALATANPGKIQEMSSILEIEGIRTITRNDLGIDVEIQESGLTFMENAIIKAQTICEISGLASIGDDSGLSVDALDGEPGVYSSRYGGDSLDDTGRCLHLLNKLDSIDQRGAKFVCAVACAFPDGTLISAVGECVGEIVRTMTGHSGFGYDPIFLPNGMNRTIGQMSQEEKNTISHRSKALKALVLELKNQI